MGTWHGADPSLKAKRRRVTTSQPSPKSKSKPQAKARKSPDASATTRNTSATSADSIPPSSPPTKKRRLMPTVLAGVCVLIIAMIGGLGFMAVKSGRETSAQSIALGSAEKTHIISSRTGSVTVSSEHFSQLVSIPPGFCLIWSDVGEMEVRRETGGSEITGDSGYYRDGKTSSVRFRLKGGKNKTLPWSVFPVSDKRCTATLPKST